jgi:hypothetical protein
VRALAPELVRPLSELRAVILQASANPEEVAVFLYENGRLRGPAAFSTLGMRIQNEQSGSTSLFAQPMAVEPVPEGSENRDQGSEISTVGTEPTATAETRKGAGFSPCITAMVSHVLCQGATSATPQSRQMESGALQAAEKLDVLKGHGFSRAADATKQTRALAPEGSSSENSPVISALSEAESIAPAKAARGTLEARMEAALAVLAEPSGTPSATLRQGYLALVKRWYYRPEARRAGEIFFPNAEGRWPVKAMLRGVGRVFASGFKPPLSISK